MFSDPLRSPMETEGGKDGHRRKVKVQRVPPPQPQGEGDQQGLGCKAAPGPVGRRVEIEPSLAW